MLKTAFLAGLTLMMFAPPASAQYYGGYGRGYDYDSDDVPPPPRRRYDYGRPARPYGGAVSPTCYTSRGPCQSTPAPVGGGCVCFVPGIGNVPGVVR